MSRDDGAAAPAAESPSGDEPDEVLDCRGQRCPSPVIELAQRIDRIPVGAVVRVLADDPAAASDIPAWCRLKGHLLLGQRSVDGAGEFDVRRLT